MLYSSTKFFLALQLKSKKNTKKNLVAEGYCIGMVISTLLTQLNGNSCDLFVNYCTEENYIVKTLDKTLNYFFNNLPGAEVVDINDGTAFEKLGCGDGVCVCALEGL